MEVMIGLKDFMEGSEAAQVDKSSSYLISWEKGRKGREEGRKFEGEIFFNACMSHQCIRVWYRSLQVRGLPTHSD